MSKLRVGLLFGGRSVEHEVSIASATSIHRALDPARYEVALIGVDREGRWRLGRPELPPAVDGRDNPIDRILDAYLLEHGAAPPKPLDDAAFLRRVSLDLVGLLPTPERLRAFAEYDDPEKRSKLIDELLAGHRAYTEHWLTFWNDLLRNDYQGTGYIEGGRKQITAWLYRALDIITTLDPKFVRAYEAGGLALTTLVVLPDESNRLMMKGMEHNPTEWKLPFLIGINYYYELYDDAKADEYMSRASRLPGAPSALATLAANLYVSGHSP